MKPNPEAMHEVYLNAFKNHGMAQPAEETNVTVSRADGGYTAQSMPPNPQVIVPQLKLQPRKG